MDLAYGPAYTAFREEVRSFLKKNWASSEQFKGDPAKLTPEQRELSGLPRVERDRAFRQKAIAAGVIHRVVRLPKRLILAHFLLTDHQVGICTPLLVEDRCLFGIIYRQRCPLGHITSHI